MRHITLILSIVILSSTCLAEEILREINWSDTKSTAGEVIEPNADCNFAQLYIHNAQRQEKTFAILTINDPCITSASYAITGQVRYEGIYDAGYLELWNHFPDGNMYFSRTLSKDSGPMQWLGGTSDWRPFTLPFYIGDAKIRPSKLQFNVVIPEGTVYLGPLKLVQFEKGQAVGSSMGAWWTDRTAGLFGGITGSIIGLFGAAIGILAGAGIARKVCLTLLGVMFAFGTVTLVAGLAALVLSQPYAVYYPMLLSGLLCTILPAVLYRTIKQRYEQKELRKMNAMDV